MPIAIACPCGKKLRVKDDLAGRRVRCPGCTTIVAVPVPDEPILLDEEIMELPAAHPRPAVPASNVRPVPVIPSPNIRSGPPVPPPQVLPVGSAPRPKAARRPDYDDDEPEDPPIKKKRKKPRKKKSSYYDEDRGSSGIGVAVHPSIIGGFLMMIGAVVWFVVGLAAGYIFFYPPVLFVLGIGAIVKGFMGKE